jgi:hypothetical protein
MITGIIIVVGVVCLGIGFVLSMTSNEEDKEL